MFIPFLHSIFLCLHKAKYHSSTVEPFTESRVCIPTARVHRKHVVHDTKIQTQLWHWYQIYCPVITTPPLMYLQTNR
jgi:hypothetical protein